MLTNANQATQYRVKARELRATCPSFPQDLAHENTRFKFWDVAAKYDNMADRAERRPPNLPAGMEQTWDQIG